MGEKARVVLVMSKGYLDGEPISDDSPVDIYSIEENDGDTQANIMAIAASLEPSQGSVLEVLELVERYTWEGGKWVRD
jgi:hypothetical protein